MIHPILPPTFIFSSSRRVRWTGGILPTFGNSWTLTLTTLAAIGLIIYLL